MAVGRLDKSMKNYYRIMLGRQSIHAQEAREGNFIGADYGIDIDLSNKLPDNWRDFNKEFISIFLNRHPEKTKVAAGLACSMLHTIAKRVLIGDVVLCPDGHRNYFVGEIVGDYKYLPGATLPHRREVRWYPATIPRDSMSQSLRNSAGAIGALSTISQYAEEIEALLGGESLPSIISTDATIEDPNIFALEKHLEDFLVQNWHHTELGKLYDIYEEDGETVGKQYPSDTGPIDILAISKDKKDILVVELKRGRVSDIAVGQLQRYMGYVKDELAEDGQTVHGVIIAFEDDIRIQRVLSVATNIDFYTYKISFKLEKK